MEAAEIDRELDELQGKVEQLRALYEQYFMGFERMEPLVQRKDLERRVKVLRREQLRNTAQRFKLNTLVQRINTMQQHWARVVREIENGTYRRDVIRAAARFGEGALAVLGQKKTRGVVAAVARAQADHVDPPTPGRPIDGARELTADDLLEDDDEATTTPKLEIPRPPARPVFAPLASPAAGLGQGDLPLVGPREQESAVRPAAVQLRAPPPPQRAAAFGELDLDFDAPPVPPIAPTAPRASAPVKLPAPPPKQSATPVFSGGFGELDLPLEGEPYRRAPEAAPSSPGSGIRPGANRPVPPPGMREAPAAARQGGELPDPRLRQIYAQYLEAKRSTQESTAGVTFDKLAASLRAQADRLKSAHPNKSVDYEVVVRDGKTHLKPVLR